MCIPCLMTRIPCIMILIQFIMILISCPCRCLLWLCSPTYTCTKFLISYVACFLSKLCIIILLWQKQSVIWVCVKRYSVYVVSIKFDNLTKFVHTSISCICQFKFLICITVHVCLYMFIYLTTLLTVSPTTY
jgi:hypothetical protein